MTDITADTVPRYIAVEGAIGAGKTTLATRLAERLNARLVLERFEDNPFLADFYRDPEHFAFQTQIFFLLARYRQQQEIRQTDLFHQFVVSDYIFDKDRIFASLTLGDHELGLYESVVSALEPNVPHPDLVIHLQSSLDQLLDNIRDRGRAMEQGIDADYLRDLSDAYARYFQHYTSSPVLIVNTAGIDFLNDQAAFDRLVEEIIRPGNEGVRSFRYPRTSAED